jgi:ABC-type sugar transport system permease subunit
VAAVQGLTARRSRRRAGSARAAGILPLGALPLLAYLVVVLVVPAGVLALYSLFTSEFFAVSRTLTLESYRRFLDNPLYLDLLVRSLAIGLLAATLLTLLGFTVAYAISFRLGRLGPRLLVVIVATLLASYVVRIYAWKSILGTEGLLNDALLGSASSPSRSASSSTATSPSSSRSSTCTCRSRCCRSTPACRTSTRASSRPRATSAPDPCARSGPSPCHSRCPPSASRSCSPSC